MSKKQILCVSTSNFLPTPTRKQNVMTRLTDAEIIYIDPPVSLLAPLKDRSALKRLRAYQQPGIKVRENITVYAAPPVWPFFNKYRWINRRNQKQLARYLKKRIKEQGFAEDPILWCYSPTSCDLAPALEHRALVYDCVDRHSAYPGMINPAVVDKMEEDLARRADMVFCTAAGLYDTLIKYNDRTRLLPNGANYELFSQAAAEAGEQPRREAESAGSFNGDPGGSFNGGSGGIPTNPESAHSGTGATTLAPATGPVFGFVGMVQECTDQACIEAVAEAYPEGQVRMIGKVLPGVDVSRLQARPNVKFMGLLPQTELPEQIRKFHVCLNAFRSGELSKDVSPLKFYEYLATGKPVVSTPQPVQVRDFADAIYIGATPAEFAACCGEALAEAVGPEGAEKTRRRIEYGKACSWDSRVAEMEQILKEKGIFS